MVKLLLLRWIIGPVAKEFDWLNMGALLPGHHPSIKDGDPLKLKSRNSQSTRQNAILITFLSRFYRVKLRFYADSVFEQSIELSI